MPLRPLPPVEEPEDRDEIRPLTPPLPFRVTPGLRATVGNKPARASATRATALLILRFELLHGLVGHLDHALQPVEFPVVVDRPPGALVHGVCRLADLPPCEFLERHRCRCVRALVVRSDHASGQDEANPDVTHYSAASGAARPGKARCHCRFADSRKRSRYKYTTGVV